jgi:hypothetical protein
MSLFQLDMVEAFPWPALCCRHTLFCGETPRLCRNSQTIQCGRDEAN